MQLHPGGLATRGVVAIIVTFPGLSTCTRIQVNVSGAVSKLDFVTGLVCRRLTASCTHILKHPHNEILLNERPREIFEIRKLSPPTLIARAAIARGAYYFRIFGEQLCCRKRRVCPPI